MSASTSGAAYRLLVLLLAALAPHAAAQPIATAADARRAYDGRAAELTLADGSVWSAAALRIAADETSWIDGGDVFRVPTCAVAALRGPARPLRFRGAAVLGAVSAGMGGLAGALVCGLDGSAEAGCVAGSAVALGAAGALVGAGIDLATRPRGPRALTLSPTCTATPTRPAAPDTEGSAALSPNPPPGGA